MANEPEREIEKTLRAYAKKRREDAGAPAELHPATRRLLHGEVARLRGSGRREAGFWPRLLWGSPLRIAFNVAVVVLLTVTVTLLPALRNGGSRHRDEQLALGKNYQAAREEPVPALKEKSPALDSMAEDKDARKAAESAKSAATEVSSDFAAAAGAAKKETAAPQTPTAAALNAPARAQAEQAQSTLAAAEPAATLPAPAVAPPTALASTRSAPVTPAVVPSLAYQDALKTRTDATDKFMDVPAGQASASSVTQQFARAIAPAREVAAVVAGESVTPPAILKSFQVVQTGNQIRVIDDDGSVYIGAIAGVPPVAASGALQKTAAVAGFAQNANQTVSTTTTVTGDLAQFDFKTNAPTSQAAWSAGAYFFRVAGTNLTLNAPVVLTGSFVANEQPAPTAGFAIDGTARGARGGGMGGRAGARPGAFGGGGGGGMASSAASESSINAQANRQVLADQRGAPQRQILNARLRGEAVVGTNRINIDAQAVKP